MICLEASFNQCYQRCIAHGVPAQRIITVAHLTLLATHAVKTDCADYKEKAR